MKDDEAKQKESFYKSKHYFDLKEAAKDVSFSFGAKDTASSIAKLAGKSLFNAGLFTGKLGLEVAKNAPDIVAKVVESNLKNNSGKMTDEQIEKSQTYVNENKGKKLF